MTEVEVIAWIFQATAYASHQEPASFAEISMLADGIMHAVPTHQEMQRSLKTLTTAGYVVKSTGKYTLTPRGHKLMDQTCSAFTLPQWKMLTTLLDALDLP